MISVILKVRHCSLWFYFTQFSCHILAGETLVFKRPIPNFAAHQDKEFKTSSTGTVPEKQGRMKSICVSHNFTVHIVTTSHKSNASSVPRGYVEMVTGVGRYPEGG